MNGLVLETPFTSIRAMLIAIYPQKWLPYRYLYPFLWNQWDSRQALLRIAESNAKPLVLILPAGRDELVPKSHAAELENVCKDGGIDVRRLTVKGALHHEVLGKHEGRQAVVNFLRSIAEKGLCQGSAARESIGRVPCICQGFLLSLPNATTFLSVPNESTSAILLVPENSIHSLSIPQPQPPVGGNPHSSAWR